MKTLFILRHAKSSWDHPQLSDFDRPLNKRGKRSAPFMSNLLKVGNEQIDLVMTSPAKRTMETCKSVIASLELKSAQVIEKKEIYEAGVTTLVELVQSAPNEVKSLLLIGHNPGLTGLSNYLTSYYIDNIPTAGLVKITFEVDDWQAIISGSGTLAYFKYPKAYMVD
jgi:phosphohistidine phosphatase